MKPIKIFLLMGVLLFLPLVMKAEVKMDTPSGGIFPKLPKTPDDPILENSRVYPFWGAPCTRYTYSVVYRDKEGRAPEYMKMYFNGQWLDIEKQNPEDNDYKRGVKYIYQYVPDSTDSNFYFFEASNGLGKARAGIIDSPDNGPVLFTSALDKNEIVVISRETGEFVWRFSTGKEWVSEVAISENNEYLAAKTSSQIYLFKLDSGDLVWKFDLGITGMMGGDVAGGVDISSQGDRIAATMGSILFLFSSENNKPLWQADIYTSAYAVAISEDGKYIGVATAGEEENENSNLLLLFSAEKNEPLWQYHSSGNFHGVDLSQDGSRIAAATGCPDRRAYIFSRESREPLIRTEMLTRDSPVDEAVISNDGQYAAFGSESDRGGVHFFKTDSRSERPLWQFPMPNNKSVRALSMTPSGQYIGVASFGGDVYIFSQESKEPLHHFSTRERLGAVDLSSDGSFIVAGGSNRGIHLWEAGKEGPVWENTLQEYINTLDISSDGRYIAAGTGGSVYFFESDDFNPPQKQVCSEIIEPPAEPSGMTGDNLFQGEPDLSQCGDEMCDLMKGENKETCPADCLGEEGEEELDFRDQFPGGKVPSGATPQKKAGFPWIIVLLSGGFIVLAVVLVILWRKGILLRLFKKFKRDR